MPDADQPTPAATTEAGTGAAPVPVEARWGLPAPGAAEFWRARRRLYDLGTQADWLRKSLWVHLPLVVGWGVVMVATMMVPLVLLLLTAQPLTQPRPRVGVGLVIASGWVAVMGMLLPAVLIAVRKARSARSRLRSACAGCGYDRGGLPSVGECPECGCRLMLGDLPDVEQARVLRRAPELGRARSGLELGAALAMGAWGANGTGGTAGLWTLSIGAVLLAASLFSVFMPLTGSRTGPAAALWLLIPFGVGALAVAVVLRDHRGRRARVRACLEAFERGDVTEEPAR